VRLNGRPKTRPDKPGIIDMFKQEQEKRRTLAAEDSSV